MLPGGFGYTSRMDQFDRFFEQFKVHGKDLAEKIRELIHQGNVRRIIIRDEQGHTFLEIPLTIATIGVIAAPVLAAVGAIASLVAKFDIVVERAKPADADKPAESPITGRSAGPTEEQVNMAGTVPQREDKKGKTVDDLAGTGQHDTPGG